MDQVFPFLLWPKREVHGPWKQGRKKRGSITCPTDWANEANKMFIIWLCSLFRFWKSDRELEVRTATYGPGIDQSQHAESVSHIISVIKYCSRSCTKWTTHWSLKQENMRIIIWGFYMLIFQLPYCQFQGLNKGLLEGLKNVWISSEKQDSKLTTNCLRIMWLDFSKYSTSASVLTKA